MIEVTILQYLNSLELSATVYAEIPATRPSKFFVLEKTGSSMDNHITRSTFAIQSYAPSMYEAAALNERVKTAMENAITLDSIASVTLNSDYNYTNTASKRYRYQAVFDVIFYD